MPIELILNLKNLCLPHVSSIFLKNQLYNFWTASSKTANLADVACVIRELLDVKVELPIKNLQQWTLEGCSYYRPASPISSFGRSVT
jgi:hypothetical protein